MKTKILPLLFLLTACVKAPEKEVVAKTEKALAATTRPAHVIVVWFENKGYGQIVGSTSAPYINSLIKQGTLFTSAYAITHPSYPNYIAWFSGSTQGVTNDNCISGQPFKKATLFDALKSVGVSGAWYSESMPANGSGTCSSGYYVEKHNPTTVFPTTYTSTYNKVFSASYFADTTKYAAMPSVVVITPNLVSDMHNGSIAQGDTWLKNKLGKLASWCTRNNSVFIVYYDEDNKAYGNKIPVVAVGEHVKAGYQDPSSATHYSFTKAILKMYGGDTSALGSNVKNAKPITL